MLIGYWTSFNFHIFNSEFSQQQSEQLQASTNRNRPTRPPPHPPITTPQPRPKCTPVKGCSRAPFFFSHAARFLNWCSLEYERGKYLNVCP